jgi:hypothetical protein
MAYMENKTCLKPPTRTPELVNMLVFHDVSNLSATLDEQTDIFHGILLNIEQPTSFSKAPIQGVEVLHRLRKRGARGALDLDEFFVKGTAGAVAGNRLREPWGV